jgi:hypothetical protein
MWKLALVLLLPLVWHDKAKLRTWAAMMGGSAIAAFSEPSSLHLYILIDALSGYVVLRHPIGCAQRAIGLLFAMMVMAHVGYLVSDIMGSTSYGSDLMHWNMQYGIGWIQLAILGVWGAGDAVVTIVDRWRAGGNSLAYWARAR